MENHEINYMTEALLAINFNYGGNPWWFSKEIISSKRMNSEHLTHLEDLMIAYKYFQEKRKEKMGTYLLFIPQTEEGIQEETQDVFVFHEILIPRNNPNQGDEEWQLYLIKLYHFRIWRIEDDLVIFTPSLLEITDTYDSQVSRFERECFEESKYGFCELFD